MPVIPVYEAPQLGLQPSETGIDALQQAARRVGAFASESGQLLAQTGQRAASAIKDAGEIALKSIEHHETSAGAKNYADMMSGLMADWTQTAKNADPNDASIAAKWRETVMEPALEQFASKGFLTEGGQQWAQNHVAALRQHLVEKNNQDMSTLAGVAAHANFAEVTNKLASTVRLDPSSLDFALKTADTSLGGIVDSSPNISATDRARVRAEGLLKAREGIVKSAVIGMIEKNPNLDLSAIESKYGQYMQPGEMSMLANYAKALVRSNRAADLAIEREQRQRANDAVHIQAGKIWTDNVSFDETTGQVRIKPDYFKQTVDLPMNNPTAPDAVSVASTRLAWGETQQNRKDTVAHDNPTVRQDLLSRMGAPENPTTEQQILRADINGDLTPTTRSRFLQLQKAIAERPEGESLKRQRDQFTKAYARLIDGMMNDAGVHSVLGSQKMYEFEMDARAQEEDLRKQGKNPALIYDPRSPDFWGRPENLARYRVSLQQAQQYEKDLKAIDAERDKTAATEVKPTGFVAPKDWQWSPSRRQYRDQDGKVYDAQGRPVKR